MSRPIINPARAIHWILDWDGTLTRRDTLDALVNIAHRTKPHSDIPSTWAGLTRAYLSDHEATLKKFTPDGCLPSTVGGERTLLKDLQEVEQRSIDRVSASGIFKGLTRKDISSGAARALETGEVQLRNGSHDLLGYLHGRMWSQLEDGDRVDSVDILSVNWSQAFIKSALETAIPVLPYNAVECSPRGGEGVNYGPTESKILQKLIQMERDDYSPHVEIHSNELQGLDAVGGSNGVICAEQEGHKLISSAHKLAHLQDLQRMNPLTLVPLPIVYVGDSWTDFECLLAADLGICIRDEPMTSSQKTLRDSLERMGIECPHINDRELTHEWSVVWARDFLEVLRWLQERGTGTEAKPE